MRFLKFAGFLVFVFGLPMSGFSASPIVLNEFVASSNKGLADEDGDFSDWVELHNSGTQPVNLQGWALTDDEDSLRKWEFPSINIPAGGYLVVFASGKNRNSPKLHASFSLSAAGEYLALVEPDGTIAQEFAPAYPEQRENFSYARGSDGSWTFSVPTPGAPNNGLPVQFVGDTKFSHDRGFYDAPFELVITTATEGATIRYTTNGQAPTASSGLVYSSPIQISRTTTIRAAAFKTGFQPSDVDTQTYLFLDDVIRQSPTGSAPTGWPSSWGQNSVDYGMDPDIVNNPKYRDTIKNDLKTIPSFSIVMKLDDLFHPSTGIYANPREDGRTWERPCSMELIYPDGREGFQANAGIRIRGGFSRDPSNPKHAFRFFFRDEYGEGKLKYPVFGPDAAQEFDGFDLRTFQNYSWSFQGDSSGIFMRDQFSRDTQRDMGYNYERGDFYHLYINGQYWGLYNTCERPEASYAESYFGGSKEDYDVIKVEAGPYTINATDGTMNAWNAFYSMAAAGFSSTAAYQKVQGNNPDGTPNPNYPVYLDVPNLIDYMLVIIYGGNKDAPISDFLGNENPNNWFGVRNRNTGSRQGFQFFSHDAEHTLLPWEPGRDRTGPFSSGDTGVLKSNPQWIWQKLWANADFKMEVADHIHRHFFNDGVLTAQKNKDRLMARKNEIDRAIVGESARWGDSKVPTPFTRDETWVGAVNSVLSYMTQRSTTVFNQLRAKGLYPTVTAPSFNKHGGNIDPGFVLTMSAPVGPIYYTLDGSDPRLPGGGISSKARTYSSGLSLQENVNVKARVLTGGKWSALNDASFNIIQTFKELVITEIMYNPPQFGGVDGERFEFIELKNVGSTTLDLSGIRFTNGITYQFPNGTKLSSGEFYVIVSDPESFAAKYPSKRVDGIYDGQLSNSGEALALVHAAGEPIAQFAYDDNPPWPTTPDGGGFSLVPRSTDPDTNWGDAANWRASARIGGSPGEDDPPINLPPVVINEVLTHTDSPQLDYIELYNPTGSEADVSGWFLTDKASNPKKFQIPQNSVIPAGGYLVFDEDDFNSQPGVEPNFTLSSHGEEVHLFSAEADGTLSGYSQGFAFGAAANGVSFGRYTNSVGEIYNPAQTQTTPGTENSGPVIGPVVINEILYWPQPGEHEFVELKNITASAVKLYDVENPTNTWQLEGVSFAFPENAEIAANGIVLVVGTEPSAFRTRYNIPASVPVFGPFTGNLQDNGEAIRLSRPDSPDVETNGVVIPMIVVDEVRYDDRAPWPTNAAGGGPSLERLNAGAFGNDQMNWRASPGAASPGLENDGNRFPSVKAGLDAVIVSSTFPAVTNLTAIASDDGLPANPGKLTYKWEQVSGPAPSQIINANQAVATFEFPGVGVYVLGITVSDGELEAVDQVTVTVQRPTSDVTFVERGAEWGYLDNGSNQGTSWKELSFSEAWKRGRAEFGYGDGDEVTTVNSGPTSSRYITTYFRKKFAVTRASSVVDLFVRYVRDDGLVIYLNGKEILRDNMPSGTVGYTTPASSIIGGADEAAWYERQIDQTLLRDGENLIAVEVHQQHANSTDISFNLELTGHADFSNEAPTAYAGVDLAVELPAPAELNGVVTDDGLPNPPGVFSVTWSMISGPAPVTIADANSVRTTAEITSPGEYVFRLTVTDGQLSATDDVIVTATGGDAYTVWKNEYFTSQELADPAIGGDDADPDGDGFDNQAEFIAGTNPRDGNSFLHVEQAWIEGSDLVLRFEAAANRGYSIEARENAESGEWESVREISPQPSTVPLEILDEIPLPTQKKFYRIVTPQRGQPD